MVPFMYIYRYIAQALPSGLGCDPTSGWDARSRIGNQLWEDENVIETLNRTLSAWLCEGLRRI
jgi:hypothetical protein